MPANAEYKLRELLDVSKLQGLLDSMDEVYSLPSAIIDTEGNILTATSWQDICTKFHRVNPETEKLCIESDSRIFKELENLPPHVIYKCPQGLVDTVTPIIIDGVHYGNAFTGQLFLDPPDEGFFRDQARRFSFDEDEYISAMRRVPVITEQRLKQNLRILANITVMLAELGLRQKRELEIQRKLRDSELRLNTILDNVGAYIFIKDTNYRYTYANRMTLDLFRCSAEQLVGKGDDAFFSSESVEEIMKSDRPVIELGQTIKREEVDLSAADGVPRTYLATKLPLHDTTGKVRELCGISTDITERKMAEDKLARSLREKEILLKEIHHRVKNNMAIISSLLRMQSAYVTDPDVLGMFLESQGRIKAMALVHDKLYKTENLLDIDVPEYIASLADSVREAFENGQHVGFVFDVDQIGLSIDTLIPCGLIINELLTNAFKYAFEGASEPVIGINLKANECDIRLEIADNGRGLPEGFDMHKATGLGLKIVTALCRQLRGVVEHKTEGGASFTLTFPAEPASSKTD